ncbi:VOC family protein [Nocardioides sp. SYSU D00038]|uniref:VOC family protein n=1 Tax=Nocardioides sp. SYSU D00038 TaxID=2812554 RepID=UPI00196852EC|nr:VOC family protein [Nocardioides sp. SYSU D00038]
MRGRTSQHDQPDRDRRTDYWGVVLDSRDPHRLARFYAELLDWRIGTEEDAWVTVRPPDGVAYLACQLDERHEPPVWPSAPGRPTMQLHLDLEVDDLDAAVADAVALGAEPASYQPQDDVRVLLDPDGHPFCLYRSSTGP